MLGLGYRGVEQARQTGTSVGGSLTKITLLTQKKSTSIYEEDIGIVYFLYLFRGTIIFIKSYSHPKQT